MVFGRRVVLRVSGNELVVHVTDEVFAHARAIERSYTQPVLRMRTDSPLDRALVAESIERAIGSLAAGDEMYWSVDDDPAGVVVSQWGVGADFAATLAAFSQALAVDDLEGRLVLHTPPPPRTCPPLDDRDQELLECHVRVRGKRCLRTQDPPRWSAPRQELVHEVSGFEADDDALLAGFDAALDWLAQPDVEGAVCSELASYGDLGELRADIAMSLSRETLGRERVSMRAWRDTDDEFRQIAVFGKGDISCAVGGARLAAGAWQDAYGALLDVLRGAAPWAAYGFVKRGRKRTHVGHSLTYDWLPAPHCSPQQLRHVPFEDALAPDAFGAQLLGPGYVGRVPGGADWICEDLGAGTVVLTHRDPNAWFGEPLPPITFDDNYRPKPSYPTPEVVLRAREEFAEILLSGEFLESHPIAAFGA